ncbi:MAG: PaaX family transcriptional regulator [Solirubrobacteraceae bacterium]
MIDDDQLRRRSVGTPAARSLLLTILGEYLLPRPEGVWYQTLVAALRCVGYREQAARQALSRSVRDGWLIAERHGRRARLSLSASERELLGAGAQRIYSFGEPWTWDGGWLIVILRVPERSRARRHQLRSRLAWAGLGSLGAGVWITPHAEREQELAAAFADEPDAEARSFRSRLGAIGDARALAADAWDLDAVRAQYETFVADFSRLRPSTPEACFRAQTLLVHAWRRFPFLDPDLPAPLLAKRWPRARAQRLFADRHERWRREAQAHFARLEAEPAAASLRGHDRTTGRI